MQKNTAFTLIEISVVLVIVALLAAGIMVGRSIIEGATLQSVAADFDQYRNAALSYRNKYGELPGDHSGAVAVSGVAADADCAAAPSASNSFTNVTCDGNGDGVVGDNTGNPLAAQTSYHESLWFWQHLMNEGLIQGQYNGRRTGLPPNEITIGVNAPESKLAGVSFQLRNFPTNTTTTGYFQASYGHVFFYGAPGATADLPFNGAALTTEQAKAIDLKIDDGKPGLGKVLTALDTASNPCTTSDVETTAAYDGAITTAACALIFITGF